MTMIVHNKYAAFDVETETLFIGHQTLPMDTPEHVEQSRRKILDLMQWLTPEAAAAVASALDTLAGMQSTVLQAKLLIQSSQVTRNISKNGSSGHRDGILPVKPIHCTSFWLIVALRRFMAFFRKTKKAK